MLSVRRGTTGSAWDGAPTETLSRRASVAAKLRQPVLIVAAALFGAGVASAIFVGVWKAADTHRQTAQTKLADANTQVTRLAALNGTLQARNGNLRRGIEFQGKRIARLEQTASQRSRAAAALASRNRALGGEVATIRHGASGVAADASTLSGTASKVGSALASLQDYLARTTGSTVDPGFLRAQVTYLKSRIDELQGSADSVSGAARSLAGG